MTPGSPAAETLAAALQWLGGHGGVVFGLLTFAGFVAVLARDWWPTRCLAEVACSRCDFPTRPLPGRAGHFTCPVCRHESAAANAR